MWSSHWPEVSSPDYRANETGHYLQCGMRAMRQPRVETGKTLLDSAVDSASLSLPIIAGMCNTLGGNPCAVAPEWQ
jgi:hypothetical protein